MKTILQIPIVLLFAIQNLAVEENEMQYVASTQRILSENEKLPPASDKTTESSCKSAELEIIQEAASPQTNSSAMPDLEGSKNRAKETAFKSSNLEDNDLVQIVLKDATHSKNPQQEMEAAKNSTKYFVKLTSNLSSSSDLDGSDLVQIVLKEVMMSTKNQGETGTIPQNSTKTLPEINTTTTADKDDFIAKSLTTWEETQNSNLAQSELAKIVLNRTEIKNAATNSTQYLIKATKTPLTSLEASQHITHSLNGVVDATNSTLKLKELRNAAEIFTESAIAAGITSTSSEDDIISRTSHDTAEMSTEPSNEIESSFISAQAKVTPSPSVSLKALQNSSLTESHLVALSNVIIKQQEKDARRPAETSTESWSEVAITTSTRAENELTTNSPIGGSEAFQQDSSSTKSQFLQQTSLKIIQEEIRNPQEISTESLAVAETRTPTVAAEESTKKPLISLEEYAVKQMNFILDYLLIETQEFVAQVLQTTVNSAFPRDYLKLYAENLNSLLNPDPYSDEDEVTEIKTNTPDEIYEEILQKLNFLKSKSSKFLQKHLPPGLINDYRNKRAELAIWLDKAAEQMHKEFNSYITEEEDYIKYKYFNETFDDISRATEIHHKLALLADLVKIVKNKKQITFMDLYMQA